MNLQSLLISAFSVLAIGCSGLHHQAQEVSETDRVSLWKELAEYARWKPYDGNPILSPGPPGQWDSWAVMSMSVVRVDDLFHLYYEGGATGVGDLAIGHATSHDGLRWEKDPANPILSPGKPGEWDDGGAWDPFVLYEDGLFKMWYGGERAGHRDFQCGYAVSTDGTEFTKKGKISTFELGDIGDMHVFHDHEEERYLMYYWDRSLPMEERLRVASSPNETDFDFEHAQTIRILGEEPGHRYTHVFKDGDFWIMYYGFDGGPPRSGYAVSRDGLTWEEHNVNLEETEDAEILSISDDLHFMFYCPAGLQDEAGCDIRLAILGGPLGELRAKRRLAR